MNVSDVTWFVYHDNWACKEDLERDFSVKLGVDIDILFASYKYGDYDGYAEVVFQQDGQLLAVSGSHCSCYGLEDQWNPQGTSVKTLRHIRDNGHIYKGGYFMSEEAVMAFDTMLAWLEEQDAK